MVSRVQAVGKQDEMIEQARIEAYFAAQKDALLADICHVVRIKSDKGEALPGKPFGEGPAAALAELLRMADGMGFRTRNYENYVGTVDFNAQETQLAILAHLDVVPAGNDWTVTPPYEPVVRDGKLYGRGSADDKGPAIVALYAMKALKDLGVSLKKNVRLIVGTDEECGSSDIAYYYSKEKEDPMTFSPDASFPVINIEKARLVGTLTAPFVPDAALPRVKQIDAGVKENVVHDVAKAVVEGLTPEELAPFLKQAEEQTGARFTAQPVQGETEISVKGKAAHASTPEQGNNALTALLELLTALPLAKSESAAKLRALAQLFPHGDTVGKAAGVAMSDAESGALTISLNMLHVDADGLSGVFDCRAPLCANEENLQNVLQKRAEEAGLALRQEFAPAHHVPGNTPFVRTLLKCYEQYTGRKGECMATGGGTYVHELENGVAFGCSMPETDNRMHGADEFAVVDELLTAAKIYTQAILELCGEVDG